MEGPGTLKDVLQPGRNQIAAGYGMYGSSVMMVYTTGQGVHGFTLDPTIGEFVLSHPNLRIPPVGRYYSVNESYFGRWTKAIQRAVRGFHGDFPSRIRARNAPLQGAVGRDFPPTPRGGGLLPLPGGTHPPGRKFPPDTRF